LEKVTARLKPCPYYKARFQGIFVTVSSGAAVAGWRSPRIPSAAADFIRG
jgi:hypothetical protein